MFFTDPMLENIVECTDKFISMQLHDVANYQTIRLTISLKTKHC